MLVGGSHRKRKISQMGVGSAVSEFELSDAKTRITFLCAREKQQISLPRELRFSLRKVILVTTRFTVSLLHRVIQSNSRVDENYGRRELLSIF